MTLMIILFFYRQLEDELQSKTALWEEERNILAAELERLRGELEKERSSVATGAAPVFLQEQVTRLCSENLELQEKLDKQVTKSRRLNQEKIDLMKKLQEAGGMYSILFLSTDFLVNCRVWYS